MLVIALPCFWSSCAHVAALGSCSVPRSQKEFGKIFEDISRFSERFTTIDKRNNQLSEDFRKLQISVDAITNRANRIKDLEFDQKDLLEAKKK